MAVPSIFAFFLVSHLVILHSVGQNNTDQYLCPESFNCGTLGQIKFPFSTNQRCGLRVNCTESVPQIRLRHRWFEVDGSLRDDAVKINVRGLKNLTNSKSCEFSSYFNLPIPTSPFISFTSSHNLTLFKCDSGSRELLRQADDYFHGNQSYGGCKNYIVYYTYPNPQLPAPANLPSNCVAFQLPALPPARNQNASDLFSLLAVEFYVGLNVSNECQECRGRGGQCQSDREEFQCVNQKQGKRSNLTLILATVIPGGVILLLCFLVLTIWCSNNWSYVFARNTSSDPSSKADLEEGGSIYFGIAVFSYTELQEAANNFDPSKELGDGGFGTVYYGKLVDGREVAVKRLYDNNDKRVTQFMNEIEILTRLHHRNLVTLYGCTSRLSRELLLVYEYIPNGTVADHLHGDRAKTGSLPWPIRMNIAIETASALAYLHASDIIHRDVKTNNILLDNNFCVKVADFGLSRLFPRDLTHVSTAPQGTPGYVDPQYHQSYQLTDKSDVYSFGVVLIELISSMPALDISRNEISLANLAVNRIQNRAFNDLIDPSLGFESDCSIERMVISVAEMAFRCLQHEKEMRPTMDEVLESLKEIQDYGDEKNGEVINDVGKITSKQSPPSPEQGTSSTRSCD